MILRLPLFHSFSRYALPFDLIFQGSLRMGRACEGASERGRQTGLGECVHEECGAHGHGWRGGGHAVGHGVGCRELF